LDDVEVLEWVGRFIARIHSVGQKQAFATRPTLNLQTFAIDSRDWLLEHNMIPLDQQATWTSWCDKAIAIAKDVFTEYPSQMIRLNRIHLEEDVAKSTHQSNASLIDFNRAGTNPPGWTDKTRNLLKLILQIVDNSLQISSESVDAGHYAPISQLAEHINSESWLLTAEYFPNNPVRKTPTGDLLQARRYLADERRDGSRKTLREECADCVCNKHLYTGKNSNPGLLTVHCMYCCVNVGFSFLARPESVRTCFNLFWHRQMLREPRDELDNDAILCENEMEEPVDDAQAMSSVPDDLQASTADSEQEYVSSAESTSSVL
jgi:hypothetical protein